MSTFMQVVVVIRSGYCDYGVDEKTFVLDPQDEKSISIAVDHIINFIDKATHGMEEPTVEEISEPLNQFISTEGWVVKALTGSSVTFRNLTNS